MCDDKVGTLCPAHPLAHLLTSALGLCCHSLCSHRKWWWGTRGSSAFSPEPLQGWIPLPGPFPGGGPAWLWDPLVTAVPFRWDRFSSGQSSSPSPPASESCCSFYSLVSARHRLVQQSLPSVLVGVNPTECSASRSAAGSCVHSKPCGLLSPDEGLP